MLGNRQVLKTCFKQPNVYVVVFFLAALQWDDPEKAA